MRAKRVEVETAVMMDPASSVWDGVEGEVVSLGGTPVQNQPSRYIRTAWAERAIGAVRTLMVKVAHNGRDILFRLEWPDVTANREHMGIVFCDAAGVLFPLNGEAPLATMGSAEAPVNAWYWRADFEEAGQNIVARGLGTVEEVGGGVVACRAQWERESWRLVLARSLALPQQAGQGVQLGVGQSVKVAFAVWEGGSGERAGIKAFSKQWRELVIEG